MAGAVHLAPAAELIDRTSAYGVAFRDNEVLLTKEQAGDGFWDLPGGGVDEGESFVAALERELCEETGLSLTSAPRPICQFEEHFFERTRGEAWRSRRHFYVIGVCGSVRTDGNGDDLAGAAFLRVEDTRIAPVAAAVIQIARDTLEKSTADYD
ncbi:NUDIX domain-containing protein [Mycobacterium stomatepiae]|nr:NUDIX domain-containing protein [Mycobacterium stomatepiae]